MARPRRDEKLRYKGLTHRQFEVLVYIMNFTAEHPYPPTVREIARHFGISATAAANHLRFIERAGFIVRDRGVTRGIWVLPKVEEFSIPARSTTQQESL